VTAPLARALRLALAVLASAGLASGSARAGEVAAASAVVVAPLPAVGACWVDVRLFDTLRHGPFDYCRDNLRYRPGALECYQFTDQVCPVFFPGSGLVETRSLVHSHVFRCPPGPEPPVCRRLTLR
jgi:hypothetical protein